MRDPPFYSDQMESDRRTGKLDCLALVWVEDEDENTKPPDYQSLIFTGQSDAMASYLSFSHSHHSRGKF